MDLLDTIYREGRTFSRWLDQPVSDDDLRRAWDLARLGPTSANCQPLRILFLRGAEAKERLKPFLDEGNVAKTMAAPVTAIMAQDLEFFEHLPRLYPQADARSWYAGRDELSRTTAFRNATLQAGYFLLACRAVGLDCGPMSGFDNAGVDGEFFPGGTVRSNFLINIGHGDRHRLHPRNPRLEFAEACQVL